MHVQQMIESHPAVQGNVNPALIKCIEECLECAQACVICADACLGEETVLQLRQCIRLNNDCADICEATARVGSRRTGSNEEVIATLLQACQAACAVCAEECEMHAKDHAHCKICAQSCRRCEAACAEASNSLRARH